MLCQRPREFKRCTSHKNFQLIGRTHTDWPLHMCPLHTESCMNWIWRKYIGKNDGMLQNEPNSHELSKKKEQRLHNNWPSCDAIPLAVLCVQQQQTKEKNIIFFLIDEKSCNTSVLEFVSLFLTRWFPTCRMHCVVRCVDTYGSIYAFATRLKRSIFDYGYRKIRSSDMYYAYNNVDMYIIFFSFLCVKSCT